MKAFFCQVNNADSHVLQMQDLRHQAAYVLQIKNWEDETSWPVKFSESGEVQAFASQVYAVRFK